MTIDFTPYELLPFRKEQEEALIALVEKCYAEYGQKIELDTLDADLLRIDEAYPAPRSFFGVLLDKGKLVGSVAVKSKDDNKVELKRLFVDPARRKQGLGKKLSLWAFDWARERRWRAMTIWSDVLYETAHRLYRGLGAEETGQRRVLGGVNNVEELCFEMRLDRKRKSASPERSIN